MVFRARDVEISFPRPATIVGIVNVTPDSFSDGGRFFDTEQAIAHALQLVAEGAEIIDIGGESTRPRAPQVPVEEELRRVIPVIKGLAGKTAALISVDTQKAAVARQAIAAGASIINDIGANRPETLMFDLAAQTGAGYVLMHMQGTPQDMQAAPHYESVTSEVSDFFGERIARALRAGVSREQIILDPGIGFGKTTGHNLELLAGLDGFKVHGRPMLLGASRKSFMHKLFGLDLQQRLGASIASALWAVERGVQFVRAHDVAETVRAVRMWEAIQSVRK